MTIGAQKGDLRIQHTLGELIGASYGRVVNFYTRRRSLPASTNRLWRKP